TLVSFGSPLPASERSIYDDEGREAFVPYPNPASDYIHVTADSEKPVSVSVTNFSGVEVLARDEVNQKVNVGSLSSGIYLMKVERGEEIYTYRFLKK
ncbi:MAG: T9SS type A sorting domain-containing protein, partial [Marinilabilia sp.]